MSNKLTELKFSGFRGAKGALSVNLPSGCPLLLFGENGTGKSTIADSIEWFYQDKISHLRGEDFAKKYDGVRNREISQESETTVSLKFTTDSRKLTKKLTVRGENYRLDRDIHSDFESYLESSKSENLIIRNAELVTFIISTKAQRLADISELIGYSEVLKTKQLLRKAVGDITSQIRSKGFESQISTKQSQLLSMVKANCYEDGHFFSAIDNLVSSLNLGYKIDSKDSFSKLKEDLSKAKPSPLALIKKWLKESTLRIESAIKIATEFESQYAAFCSEYQRISQDAESMKGLRLKSLLDNAAFVIEKKIQDTETCPVCLQSTVHSELLSNLKERIEKLKRFDEQKQKLEVKRKNIKSLIADLQSAIEISLRTAIPDEVITSEFILEMKKLNESIAVHRAQLEKETNFTDGFKYSEAAFSIETFSKLAIKGLEIENAIVIENDPRILIGQTVAMAESAFSDFLKLQKEKNILDRQRLSLEFAYNRFVVAQKDELSKFLSAISDLMNEYVRFMYPDDQINGIELKTVEDADGDFIGVSYNLIFRGGEVKVPQALLSESYLNCLGLSLFLASAKIFNKKNKFFVLDDVVSSFDRSHRARFARLLVEKFADWQPLVLTHEDEWFAYLGSLVRSKGWIIKCTKWSPNGTVLDEKAVGLREEIENKFKTKDALGLGNLIGRYTESLLKELCESLDAPIRFRSNTKNEDRTLHELFSAIRARLKDKKTGLDSNPIVVNLETTQFFRNKTSHGNGFGDNLGDLSLCFEDVKKFEQLFTGADGSRIAIEHVDTVNDRIRNRDGTLIYNWK